MPRRVKPVLKKKTGEVTLPNFDNYDKTAVFQADGADRESEITSTLACVWTGLRLLSGPQG